MTFAAIFPPMATPFVDGEVDTDAVRANIARWVAAGVGGVVALGTNGEAPLLDEMESDRVVAAARAALPRERLLIVGTGRESTRAARAASRRAAELGADAVLIRTPFFYKPRMTAEAFLLHYTAIADACPVPVLLYNYPGVTGVNLAPDVLARLSEHANIVGVKETGSDTAQVAAYVSGASRGFAVIAGSAPTFYPSLCVGATGGILAIACVVPELCIRLYDHFRAGEHEEARDLQRLITPLARLVTTEFGVPGLKAAMNAAGYVAGEPRSPLAPAPSAAIDRIRAELVTLQTACAQVSS